MNLTILGSGTVVPDGNRNSAGYFVQLPETKLMLDCGAGTLHALDRYHLPWQEMTHLFISHFHVDHIGELASLFFAFKHGMRISRTRPLILIAGRGIERVMKALKEAFGDDLFQPRFAVNLQVVEPGDTIDLGSNSKLLVAKTPHTSESLAVRIESSGSSLCYTGDTGYSDHLAEFFADANVLISECSFLEPRDGVPHLAVKDVAALAQRARVRRLIVTHFYFEVDHQVLKRQLEKVYSGEVVIGADGLEFKIP
jgi:ribonuclease BN (tRNA processing enzyme)